MGGGVRPSRRRSSGRRTGIPRGVPPEDGTAAAPGGRRFGWHRESAGSVGNGSSGRDTAGLRYDYSDTQEALDLSPGSRIVHPRFGPGEILGVTGRGRDAKADIEFDDVGRKKVVVAFADLRPA